ncbi:MAG: hypothetical protein KY429_04955 [Actinobacteria bacterium]|nr:hypothetical protein [Actinomycetota bacterium]
MNASLKIIRPAVATSIQDQGRFGSRAAGFSRSGAMDPASLETANLLAGAAADSAGLELGPGPFEVEIQRTCLIAFGGAIRDGAPWWETIEARAGMKFSLSGPLDGNWSYLSIGGGVAAQVIHGSRSTNLREGIGNPITTGDLISPAADPRTPAPAGPPPMKGPVRIFGSLPGEWRVSNRIDRMGYQLEGSMLASGPGAEWSEPVLPGCIQLYPSGLPVVLMAEGSTVGGYRVVAVVHSADLRLISQSRPGERVDFIEDDSLPKLTS